MSVALASARICAPLGAAALAFLCASVSLIDHRWMHYQESATVMAADREATWSWWHLERNRGLLYQVGRLG